MLHENESTKMKIDSILDDMFSNLKISLQRKPEDKDSDYMTEFIKYPFFAFLTNEDLCFILYLADYLYTVYKTGNNMTYHIYSRFRNVFDTICFRISAQVYSQLNCNGCKFRLIYDDYYKDHTEYGITKTVTFIYNGHEDTEPYLPPMTLKIHSFNVMEIKEAIEPIFGRIDPNFFRYIEKKINTYQAIITDMFVYLSSKMYNIIIEDVSDQNKEKES